MDLSVNIKASVDELINGVKTAMGAVSGLTEKLQTPATVKVNTDTSAVKTASDEVATLKTNASKPVTIAVDPSQAKAAINDLTDKVKGAAGELGGIGKTILSVFGGGVLLSGVSGIVGGIDKIISKGKAAIETQENLKVAFRASGLSVEDAEKALSKNAKATGELSNKYNVAKADINDATSAFLRFGGSSDNLKQKQENIIGLAAKLGGNYELAARALAKATDPEIEAQLTKFGIKFDKNATEADRQRIITEKLGTTLQGLAEKADTPLGKMQKVQNTIGGIASTIGVAIVESVAPLVGIIGDVVLPLITGTISALKAVIGGIKSFFAENAAAIKVVLTVIGSAAVIVAAVMYGSLIPAVIASASSFVAMGISAAAAWVAVNAPIIAVVAGIAALSAGIIYLYNNFEGVRKAVQVVKDVAVVVFEGLVQYAKDYWEILKAVGEIVFNVLILPFKLLWAVLSPIVSMIGDFAKGFFNLGGAAGSASGAIDIVRKGFEILHNVMSFVLSALKGVIAGITTFADTAKKVIDKVLHLDFSGAVDAAKEGGKKIGDSTAQAFNESLQKIKSEDAAKKFEEDFKKAAEAAKAAIASIDASKLGESFSDAKKKAADTAAASIEQLSGVQRAFEKLSKAQKGNDEDRKKALDAFVKESGANNIKTFEDAEAVVKATAEKLKKSQKDNLEETRKLKSLENSNSIEFANKEAQINQQTALKKKTDSIEQNRQAKEKIARDTLQSELELNIQLLQIQGEADAAKFAAQIESAKKLLALKKDLTPAQIKAEKQTIADIETAKEKAAADNLVKQQAERAKTAVKQYEEEQKQIAERLKLETEFNKKTVELAEKRKVENTQQELDRQADLINAKLDVVQAGYNQELNELLTKNANVAKADSALKNALSKGNLENVAKAKEALELAKQDAITNDANILDLRKKSNEEILKVEKESAASLQAFRISLITDDTERERQTRLLEVQKTLDAELSAARGNERLITEARQKAADARNEIEANAARKSQDANIRLIQGAKDLANGVSASIISSFAPLFDTFGALEKRFKKFADTISTDNKEANKKIEEEYKKNSAALLSQLKAREISWSDYQDKVGKLQRAGKDESSDVLGQVRKSFGEAFLAIGKDAQKNLDESFKKIAEKAKTSKVSLGSIWEDITTVATDAGASIASVLGTMAATGELTLKSAAKATLGIAIDTAEKLLLANIPAIFATFASFLPPVVSQIAAGVAIAGMYGLLATAKAAIGGFHDGGYTGDGNEYDVAGVVHRKEGVLSHAALRGDVSAFHDLHNTLKSGESLSNILARYRREGESNSLVTPLGAVITNSPATAFVAANNDTRIIAELRAQTERLETKLTRIEVGQKSAFKSNYNIGLDIAPSKFFDVIQTPRDIKRRSLQ